MSIDFPRAWQLAMAVPFTDHDPKCNHRRSEGCLLCDCEVVTKHPEYLSDVFYGKDGVVIKKQDEINLEQEVKKEFKRIGSILLGILFILFMMVIFYSIFNMLV
jgi:hypothetical protein